MPDSTDLEVSSTSSMSELIEDMSDISTIDMMDTLCLYDQKNIGLSKIPVPTLQKADDVLIQVAYCGNYWSDVLGYTAGPIFCHSDELLPLCMGHEHIGAVKETGPVTVLLSTLGCRAGNKMWPGCAMRAPSG